MAKRVIVPLIVAVLLMTAGCLGGGGPGTDAATTATTSPGDVESASGADTDSAADTGTESAPGDEWNLSEPIRALQDAGSFTATWTWRANDGTETGTIELRQTVDLANERSHLTSTTVDGDGEFVMEYFYADGVQYTRIISDDPDSESMYVATESEFESNTMLYDRGYAYDASDLEEWSSEGVTTYDGVSVRKYAYTGDDLWIGTSAWEDEEFQVTDVTFEMLVDRDGVARYQKYYVEGVTEEGSTEWFEWEYTVTNVGSTTVDDPEWLDEALEQTGG
jgi:hypothetical protein